MLQRSFAASSTSTRRSGRGARSSSRDLPDWLGRAYEECSSVWRRVASLDELTAQATS